MRKEEEQPNPADPLVTKHGVRVALGQRWRDCDKRMMHRVRYVVEINAKTHRVRLGTSMDDARGSWVAIRRMHKHSTGWELVD